jgi:hypothetical protein
VKTRTPADRHAGEKAGREDPVKKLALVAPRQWSAVALAAIALLVGSSSVRAGSCVRLDTTRDTLNPDEQKAAALLFEEALRKEGRAVDSSNCAEEWVLSHVRLGNSITVVVASPHGRRSDRVSGIEEFPAQYSQSIRALLTQRDPRNEVAGVVDRTNVTSAQAEVKRVQSESIFFVRLGYGLASGRGNGGGPVLGLGWRKELNRVALDVAFANMLILSKERGDDVDYDYDPLNGGPFTPVALGVNYHFRPLSNSTPYVGLGLGYTVWGGIDDADGRGLDVRLALGYEMFRSSTVRLFVQADGVLATYEVTRRIWAPDGRTSPEQRFRPAAFTVSLGIGFGGGQDDDDD